MSADDDRPDTETLGEFRILREIGRGGMGIVYEAEQPSLRRRVALKALPPALCADPQVVARFRREAEAAGRLRHAAIVAVHAVGEQDGRPYFAMELVEGTSLDDVLNARADGDDAGLPAPGPEWHRWAVETVARIADALHYAHAQGVLHRDVKPGNILLDRDGSARLMDFGLAHDSEAGSLTAPGAVLGTPIYMSPEQAEGGGTLDARSDVYSLAATLYRLLTGRIPYDAKTNSEVFAALLTGRTVSIASVDPAIPAALAGAVMRALSKDPIARPDDAAAFAEELRAALDAPQHAAPPVSGIRRSTRIGHAVIALGLVVLMTWAAIHFFGDDPADRGPVVPFSPFTPAGPVSWEELEALADGKAENADAVLGRWLRPTIMLRNVVSRRSPGRVRCEVAVEGGRTIGDPDGRVLLVGVWESRIDQGPWLARSLDTFLLGRAYGHHMAGEWDLAESALGGKTTTLEHRLTVIVVRPTEEQSLRHAEKPAITTPLERPEMPALDAYAGGSRWTWQDTTTVFVYDDYPADYPEVATGTEHRTAMETTLTPSLVYGPELRDEGGERYVRLSARFADLGGPLPVASVVTLHVDGHDTALGTARYSMGAAPANIPPVTVERVVGLLFRLPGRTSDEEQQALLDLMADKARNVRLVFTPSRDVALEDTQFDRYWGEPHEAVVPVSDRD